MSASSNACDQCGSTARTQGVLGLEVCSSCGAVRSFSTALRGTREQEQGEGAQADREGQLLSVPRSQAVVGPPGLLKLRPTPRERAESRLVIVDDEKRRKRVQRCRDAISVCCNSVGVQESVHQPALALLLKHCQRTSRLPSKGLHLKRLVCACVLAVSARQGMGLTLHEVAAQAELKVSQVQRAVWRLCKVNGVRLVRSPANVDSLLHRICEGLGLSHQRGAICAAAARLVTIANEGWIATGRTFAFVVCAALVLALRAYHFPFTSEQVGRTVCIGPSTIEARVVELKRVIVSLCRVLPWGHLVNSANLHVYVLFVVDFYDVLRPVAEEEMMCKRTQDEEAEE
eukprot:CAMPEP_0204582564 /NCGR_PEP_ID=MMETSP0661-20131031/45291_1 /ASSEMBLY_ACC=CAM_ASM_000606 /TAXON_ID=109239 /ORGANISM="Alexandrium margalefi, Strain AMGDE01CS-322" /LENGTH=343 /DNA_ID=CAMNT_0051591857 /DNA_START=27 /DNA_END=1055 /DNA_ORIENTATION=+